MVISIGENLKWSIKFRNIASVFRDQQNYFHWDYLPLAYCAANKLKNNDVLWTSTGLCIGLLCK